MLKNKNLTKKTQFNIRLDAVSQAQLYLIKNKLMCPSNTMAIELSINEMFNSLGLKVEDVVDLFNNLEASQ